MLRCTQTDSALHILRGFARSVRVSRARRDRPPYGCLNHSTAPRRSPVLLRGNHPLHSAVIIRCAARSLSAAQRAHYPLRSAVIIRCTARSLSAAQRAHYPLHSAVLIRCTARSLSAAQRGPHPLHSAVIVRCTAWSLSAPRHGRHPLPAQRGQLRMDVCSTARGSSVSARCRTREPVQTGRLRLAPVTFGQVESCPSSHCASPSPKVQQLETVTT
jgi:hypothetical protein